MFKPFLAAGNLQPPAEQHSLGIQLAFDQDHILIFWPHWDILPSDLNSTSPITGAFLPLDEETADEQDCVLLLQARDQHYERVGMLWLDNVLRPPTVGNHKISAEYYVCEKMPWPIGALSPYRLNALEHMELARRYRNAGEGKWWLRLTRAETIAIR